MKHFLLLSASLLLLAGSAHAQLGLRVGGNLSQFAYSNTQANDVGVTHSPRLGYQVGLFYEVPLSARVALVPEITFYRQSSQQSIRSYRLIDFGFEGDYRLTCSQLTLPLMARLKLGRFYIEAGPQLTYIVGGRQIGTEALYGFAVVRQDVDRPVTERLRRFDVGPCLGIGFQPTAALGVSVRAYYGLRTANIEAGTYTSYPMSYVGPLHQQQLQASLTYRLFAPKS